MCLHRSCGLRALTAEAHVELTDMLDVTTVPANQDDAFRDLADCVHDLSLLSGCELDTILIDASPFTALVRVLAFFMMRFDCEHVFVAFCPDSPEVGEQFYVFRIG
jgi:hypothetical protein